MVKEEISIVRFELQIYIRREIQRWGIHLLLQ